MSMAARLLEVLRVRTLPGLRPSATCDSRCVLVGLAHLGRLGVDDPTPSFLQVERIPARVCFSRSMSVRARALESRLERISADLARTADEHAATMRRPQAYAFVLWGLEDTVLRQIRFNAPSAKRTSESAAA